MTGRIWKITLVAASSAAALSLAACKEEYGAQRIAVPDPAPAAFLSAPMGLPYAEPAPVQWYAPEQGYAWAERAYGMQRAFHEVPPDYGFEYGGMQPWAWETADDWAMYAEPWDDGYRYYYYEPDAAYPYFVRDGMYGYGFDPLGALVALFDANGDYLPQDHWYGAAPLAGRYYLHGRDLRNAAVQAQRIPILEDVWMQRAPLILASSDPWIRAANYDDDWRAFRDRTGERELKRFLKEEKRREKEARKWARELRRDDGFAQRYAAAQSFEPRTRYEAARVWRDDDRGGKRAREEAQRFGERDRDERKRVAERARADQRRGAEQAREAHLRHAEQARHAQQRAEQARSERRWAEAHARDAAERGRGDGGWKAERGGGDPARGRGGGEHGKGDHGEGDRGKGHGGDDRKGQDKGQDKGQGGGGHGHGPGGKGGGKKD